MPPETLAPGLGPDGQASPPPDEGSLISNASRERNANTIALTLLARYGLLLAFLIVIVVMTIARSSVFPTVDNVKLILTQSAPPMILALGLTAVLAMRDFDLSIGAMIGLSGGVAVALMTRSHVGWALALLAGVGAGVVVGIANGYLIAFLGGPSFIITLAMGTILTGLEFAATGQQTVYSGVSSTYVDIASKSYFLGLSNQIWMAAIVAIVLWFLLDRTELGRYMYAIGGNIEAARLSGVRTRLIRMLGFIIVGVAAAIVGIILTSQGGSYTPDIGEPYLLPAYAAAFLGAACFRPGEFNIPGTVVGVLFLETVQTGLTELSLTTFLINIVQGVVLIAAVMLSRMGTAQSGA